VVGFPDRGIGFLLLKRDGTLWCLEKPFEALPLRPTVVGPKLLGPFTLKRLGGASDWAEISQTESGTLCRKTDGSLWRPTFQTYLEALDIRTDTRIRTWTEFWGEDAGFRIVGLGEDGALRLWRWTGPGNSLFNAKEARLGTETNWVAVTANNFGLVTIKSDGSLWRWGFDHEKLNEAPQRLGSHTDWIGVCASWNVVFSLAADGGVWFWQFPSGAPADPNESALSIFAPKPSYRAFYRPFMENQEMLLLAASRRPVLAGNIFAAGK
jgi:hypothetical protein